MSKISEIDAMVREYPDSANRRRILTSLSEVDELLNQVLYGIAGAQGYSFPDGKQMKKVD